MKKSQPPKGHICPWNKSTTCYEHYKCNGCETFAEAMAQPPKQSSPSIDLNAKTEPSPVGDGLEQLIYNVDPNFERREELASAIRLYLEGIAERMKKEYRSGAYGSYEAKIFDNTLNDFMREVK